MKPTSKKRSSRPALSPAAHAARLEGRDALKSTAAQLVPELQGALDRLSSDPSTWAKELTRMLDGARLTAAKTKDARPQLEALVEKTVTSLGALEERARTSSPEHQRTQLQLLATRAGIESKQFQALKLASPAAVTEDSIARLVASKRLTVAQGRKLGLGASLYALFDERAEVAAPLVGRELDELFKLDDAQWERLVKTSDAVELRARLDTVAPTRAVRGRLQAPAPAALERQLTAVAPLLLAIMRIRVNPERRFPVIALTRIRVNLERRPRVSAIAAGPRPATSSRAWPLSPQPRVA